MSVISISPEEEMYVHRKKLWVQDKVESKTTTPSEALAQWNLEHLCEEQKFGPDFGNCHSDCSACSGGEVDRAGKLHIQAEDFCSINDCGLAYIGAR
uniref:Uncharacterized protein n=1 Tax=Tetraselmis sp. GSL018 TaxID=582737 RepID=A0A061SEE9_9CHLO|eukprot:CAMPEP_0177592114 /NCGR_PEP_ID=MMETSP0419_2-20121207/8376_1 /TAXON_ID=582737 /ORGANISM="Tetraselmis sp., Strain GSL018" /LENGTH=96 /DNA_ID=CAMNT_0019082937 /DNA_START=95 /DNA_END=385 /DNA_ORIENTATION=-